MFRVIAFNMYSVVQHGAGIFISVTLFSPKIVMKVEVSYRAVLKFHEINENLEIFFYRVG